MPGSSAPTTSGGGIGGVIGGIVKEVEGAVLHGGVPQVPGASNAASSAVSGVVSSALSPIVAGLGRLVLYGVFLIAGGVLIVIGLMHLAEPAKRAFSSFPAITAPDKAPILDEAGVPF